MKKNFKIIFCAFAVLVMLPVVSHAQNVKQFEVYGGYSMPHISWPEDNYTWQLKGNSKSVSSFHVGVRYIQSINKRYFDNFAYISFGFAVSGKGYNIDKPFLSHWTGYEYSLKGHGFGVEVPVHFGGKFKLSEDLSLFAEAGFTGAVGLFGKWKEKLKGEERLHGDYYKESERAGFKRLNGSLGGRIGVEIMKTFTFSAGYDHGITKLGEYPYNCKDRVLMLSFGYMF